MADRHPKWQRVEPGTVIPAGQPHRVTYVEDYDEEAGPAPGCADVWEVDSSWKPPLVQGPHDE